MRKGKTINDVVVGAALTAPVFHLLIFSHHALVSFAPLSLLISFVRTYFSFVFFARKGLAIEKPER